MNKLDYFISKYEEENEKNDRLLNKCDELLAKIEELEEEIKFMKEKYNIEE